MIEVGSFVKGNARSDHMYGVTTSHMRKAEVLRKSGTILTLRVVQHDDARWIGDTYTVQEEYFDLYDSKSELKDRIKEIRQCSITQYLEDNFEKTSEGYIVYKTFGAVYSPPAYWDIKEGSVIEEAPNYDRFQDCGEGVNVSTLKWATKNQNGREIWKCLIEWKWLAGVVVPYGTDGKIRCERVKLLCKI